MKRRVQGYGRLESINNVLLKSLCCIDLSVDLYFKLISFIFSAFHGVPIILFVHSLLEFIWCRGCRSKCQEERRLDDDDDPIRSDRILGYKNLLQLISISPSFRKKSSGCRSAPSTNFKWHISTTPFKILEGRTVIFEVWKWLSVMVLDL